MAILEMVLTYTYAGQTCQNRWNYVASGTVVGFTFATGLAHAAGLIPEGDPLAYPEDTFFEAIRNLQNNGVDYVGFNIFDPYDPLDFYAAPFSLPAPGTIGGLGEAMSPLAAVGFVSSRTRRDVSRGTKRFAGMLEGMFGPNGVVAAVYEDEIAQAALKMSENLELRVGPSAMTFVPAICGKQRYPTNEAETKFAYRYYPTEAEQLLHTMQGIEWSHYTTMRSQRSRQYGRGQ